MERFSHGCADGIENETVHIVEEVQPGEDDKKPKGAELAFRGHDVLQSAGRMKFCDTADCKSALLINLKRRAGWRRDPGFLHPLGRWRRPSARFLRAGVRGSDGAGDERAL